MKIYVLWADAIKKAGHDGAVVEDDIEEPENRCKQLVPPIV